MRIASYSVVLLVLSAKCGCVQPESRTDPLALEEFAQNLQQAWPITNDKLQMTISMDNRNGHEVLHCRLTDMYGRGALELDSKHLPWNVGFYDIAAVSITGSVTHQMIYLSRLMAHGESWKPMVLGATWEGDIEMKSLPFKSLPRDQDQLLLWSSVVALNRNAEYVVLSGVTFLPKRSVKL